MQVVTVEMDEVELLAPPVNVFQHRQVVRERIRTAAITAQVPSAAGNQACLGDRVAAGKESDLMALPDELFRKIRYDSLRPAIVFWRNAFKKRRYLCDSHKNDFLTDWTGETCTQKSRQRSPTVVGARELRLLVFGSNR